MLNYFGQYFLWDLKNSCGKYPHSRGGKNAHKGFTEISPQMGVILVQVLEFEWCYSGPWMVGYKF